MRREISDNLVSHNVRDSVPRTTRGVDWVFRAAALKQIQSCQFFPVAAARINVIEKIRLPNAPDGIRIYDHV